MAIKKKNTRIEQAKCIAPNHLIERIEVCGIFPYDLEEIDLEENYLTGVDFQLESRAGRGYLFFIDSSGENVVANLGAIRIRSEDDFKKTKDLIKQLIDCEIHHESPINPSVYSLLADKVVSYAVFMMKAPITKEGVISLADRLGQNFRKMTLSKIVYSSVPLDVYSASVLNGDYRANTSLFAGHVKF